MMSRYEAHILDFFSPERRDVTDGVVSKSSVYSLIEAIYDSIGSCGECKHLKQSGACRLHSVDAEADVIMMDSDFCSYFERKET